MYRSPFARPPGLARQRTADRVTRVEAAANHPLSKPGASGSRLKRWRFLRGRPAAVLRCERRRPPFWPATGETQYNLGINTQPVGVLLIGRL